MAEVINNDRLSVLAESTPLAMKELNQQKRLYVILGSVQGGILGDGLRCDICRDVDVDVHFVHLSSRINKMILLRWPLERFSIERSKTKTIQLDNLANPKQ